MARIKRPGTSRRTLAGLGTVGIVAGTIAFTAGVGASDASAATISLKYDCTASAFGASLPQGEWTAAVTVDLPQSVNVGDKIPAPAVTAKVTTSTTAGDTMRSLQVTKINGTSDAAYTFGSQQATSKLTIGDTPIPTSGAITTTASGSGEAATAPSTPQDVKVNIGDFTGTLNAYTASSGDSPALTLGLTCTLVKGQNTQIGVVHVVDPNAPTSEPTSPTSTPTDTGTPTSTPTDTGTSTATSTGTATGTDTGTTTGPPIITDGGSTDGGVNGGVVGGAAVAAMGVGALGVGLRRRLSSRH